MTGADFSARTQGYVVELYERYLPGPDLPLIPADRELFARWQEARTLPSARRPGQYGAGPRPAAAPAAGRTSTSHASSAPLTSPRRSAPTATSAAQLDPLGTPPARRPASTGRTASPRRTLQRAGRASSGDRWPSGRQNALEAIRGPAADLLPHHRLRVRPRARRGGARLAARRRRGGALLHTAPGATSGGCLRRLSQVEGFEQYLHRTFPGQKRFSIEGIDMLVPMLDEIIELRRRRPERATSCWRWPTAAGSTCWRTCSASRTT